MDKDKLGWDGFNEWYKSASPEEQIKFLQWGFYRIPKAATQQILSRRSDKELLIFLHDLEQWEAEEGESLFEFINTELESRRSSEVE